MTAGDEAEVGGSFLEDPQSEVYLGYTQVPPPLLCGALAGVLSDGSRVVRLVPGESTVPDSGLRDVQSGLGSLGSPREGTGVTAVKDGKHLRHGEPCAGL